MNIHLCGLLLVSYTSVSVCCTFALLLLRAHFILVAAVAQTDRPMSVRNRCVMEVFVAFLSCHVAFFSCPLVFMDFCHRNESDPSFFSLYKLFQQGDIMCIFKDIL